MESQKIELIKHLRYMLDLPTEFVSDEDLLEGTKNTFLFARIRLYIAFKELWEEVKKALSFNFN